MIELSVEFMEIFDKELGPSYYDIGEEEFQEIKIQFLTLVDSSDKGKYVFDLKMVCSWLDVNEWYVQFIKDKKYRDDFYERNLGRLTQGPPHITDFHYTVTEVEGIPIPVPVFSVEGFKFFCIRQLDVKKSKIVRLYFTHIETCYFIALQQTYEEHEAKMKKLKADVKAYKKNVLIPIKKEREFYANQLAHI